MAECERLSGGVRVAPHWGAWIEMICSLNVSAILVSHPTGVRGLKCDDDPSDGIPRASHPTGVRGLKCRRFFRPIPGFQVAPHWGAWIEITTRS